MDMMREIEYSEAAVEVLDILNHTDRKDVELIPQSFIKFLTDISSKNYKVQLNHEQPINGMNLKKQTRELLGFIYITWWCNKEEREKYKNLIHEGNSKKEEIMQLYDGKDLFKNKREPEQVISNEDETKEEISITEYKKENIFKRFINKILSFFKVK